MYDGNTYPLKECRDCIHRRVCKFVGLLNEIIDQEALPITFSTAACTEYLSENDDTVVYQQSIDETAPNANIIHRILENQVQEIREGEPEILPYLQVFINPKSLNFLSTFPGFKTIDEVPYLTMDGIDIQVSLSDDISEDSYLIFSVEEGDDEDEG